MRRDRYIGIAFLVVGLVFAQHMIRQLIAWRTIGYPTFWGELVAAFTGIAVGVYALTSKAR